MDRALAAPALVDRTRGREAVPAATAALRCGRPVVLVDDLTPGQEGVLLVAAAGVEVATMALLVRESSGVVCVAMTGDRLDELRLPPLVAHGAGARAAAFTVSVDLRVGITTGISARDRASTARALADPATGPADLVRPGHVLPTCAGSRDRRLPGCWPRSPTSTAPSPHRPS